MFINSRRILAPIDFGNVFELVWDGLRREERRRPERLSADLGAEWAVATRRRSCLRMWQPLEEDAFVHAALAEVGHIGFPEQLSYPLLL